LAFAEGLFILRKKGFFETFVVLALRGRKTRKGSSGEIKCGIARQYLTP